MVAQTARKTRNDEMGAENGGKSAAEKHSQRTEQNGQWREMSTTSGKKCTSTPRDHTLTEQERQLCASSASTCEHFPGGSASVPATGRTLTCIRGVKGLPAHVSPSYDGRRGERASASANVLQRCSERNARREYAVERQTESGMAVEEESESERGARTPMPKKTAHSFLPLAIPPNNHHGPRPS